MLCRLKVETERYISEITPWPNREIVFYCRRLNNTKLKTPKLPRILRQPTIFHTEGTVCIMFSSRRRDNFKTARLILRVPLFFCIRTRGHRLDGCDFFNKK